MTNTPERCSKCGKPIDLDDRFAWKLGYHAECAPAGCAICGQPADVHGRAFVVGLPGHAFLSAGASDPRD